ncbi:MAG: carbohydrate ABC transporter permease [Clostridiales bacterium]|nr:carbohydrate ABC transporter permease [Clostridiales bacterium]
MGKQIRSAVSVQQKAASKCWHTIGALAKIAIIVIFIFPFVWMLSTSLKTYKESIAYPPSLLMAQPQWENFKTVWNSGNYLMYFRNTIVVTLSILAIQTFVSVPCAYALARYEFRGSGLCFAIVLISFMVPTQLTFISVYIMFADLEMLNTLWPQILPFGANAFGIFMLRQAFKQIPGEIVEAARLDGGSEVSIMLKIMLPMVKPSLVATTMFSFISHWNDYFWPFVITNSDAIRPLTVAIAQLRDSENGNQWQLVMAGNVILVLPILLVYIFLHKRIISGFVYNGIK